MAIDIERRHEYYNDWRDSCTFLWLSYEGGKAYHTSDLMLDKYPRELDLLYAERRKRAYLLNFFAATIDGYVASVFRRDPVRTGAEATTGGDNAELSQPIQGFIEDATGDGTDLNTFSRRVATLALAAERTFVGVDIRTGGTPYVYEIHPSNVLDYSVDKTTGELRWALVCEEEVVDDDPMVERQIYERYRLWTPTEWSVYDEDGTQLDSGRNSAGRVPIILVPGHTVGLPTYDISLIQKRIYNLSSQLDEILNNATFPMLYVPAAEGVSDVSTLDTEFSQEGTEHPLVVGPARLLVLPTDKDVNSIIPGWLAPPDGPARVIMDERRALVDAIRNLAGLERRDPDTISPQSGVAKAYDFRETNERLVSLAQLMEDFETSLMGLVNAYGLGGEVNVSYEKDFQVRDFQMLTETFDKLQYFILPSIVKKRAALDYSMTLAEDADEDEKQDIRKAVEEMTDFDQRVFPPGTITPPGQGPTQGTQAAAPPSALRQLLNPGQQGPEPQGGNQ